MTAIVLALTALIARYQVDDATQTIRAWDASGRLVLRADPQRELIWEYDRQGRVTRRSVRTVYDNHTPGCARYSGNEANSCAQEQTVVLSTEYVTEETRYALDAARRPISATVDRTTRTQPNLPNPTRYITVKHEVLHVNWRWPLVEPSEEALEIARLSGATELGDAH